MAARRSSAKLASTRRGEACQVRCSRQTPVHHGQRHREPVECALSICLHNADEMDVNPENRGAPADAHAKLASMGLLSPPTDEMRTAARALIHQQHPKQVEDELLRAAIERIDNELTEYERQICKDIEGEPPESPSYEALELALAQRISSARLVLASSEDEHEHQGVETDSPAAPAAASARRSRRRNPNR